MSLADVPYLRRISNAVAYTALKAQITPLTTLSADAPLGGSTISVEPLLTTLGKSRFVPGGVLRFWNASGERDRTILSVTPDGATISFDTTLWGPLAVLQPEGTIVGTNACGFAPPEQAIAPMLQHGDPVLYSWCRQASFPVEAGSEVAPRIRVYVVYARQLFRPEADPRPSDLDWAALLDEQMNADIFKVVSLLMLNPQLITPYEPALIEQLGYRASGQNAIDVPLDNVSLDLGAWRYAVPFDFYVTGLTQEAGY